MSLIDYYDFELGIKVIYKNGEICEASERREEIGKPKSISFLIYCSEKAADDETFTVTPNDRYTVTNCNRELTIHHRAGCAVSQLKEKP